MVTAANKRVLKVENIRKLLIVRRNSGDELVEVARSDGSGKTSVTEAIVTALDGACQKGCTQW